LAGSRHTRVFPDWIERSATAFEPKDEGNDPGGPAKGGPADRLNALQRLAWWLSQAEVAVRGLGRVRTIRLSIGKEARRGRQGAEGPSAPSTLLSLWACGIADLQK
jgi:hypothetical protein